MMPRGILPSPVDLTPHCSGVCPTAGRQYARNKAAQIAAAVDLARPHGVGIAADLGDLLVIPADIF